MTLAEIDNQIRSICPIDGIDSDGDIYFSESATDDQKLTALSLMNQLLPQLGVADPKADMLVQIQQMEMTQLLPRSVRLALMTAAVKLASLSGEDEPTLYANNIEYHRIKDFDTQICNMANSVNLRSYI